MHFNTVASPPPNFQSEYSPAVHQSPGEQLFTFMTTVGVPPYCQKINLKGLWVFYLFNVFSFELMFWLLQFCSAIYSLKTSYFKNILI